MISFLVVISRVKENRLDLLHSWANWRTKNRLRAPSLFASSLLDQFRGQLS
jgi:hypothetical protein